MNTSGSKDLSKKPRNILSKRKRKGQGCFHNNHTYNLINRNSSFQSHSISHSEYVLQNLNTRSHNLRLHPGKSNSGYLKHIQTQSISREKELSTMGRYEEYTLKKIRTTSDMIKQQLMRPEPVTITASETNIESVDTSSASKSKPYKLGGESSKISESHKEYSFPKMKRKSNEEITRLQIKQRRKNELREKFKRDNISRQKSNETYDAKEISDQILKHISKMNNERIMDFLNSGDSRYGEAFNYICKQKSFEVSKALRDLSHQEKPETCEIVNSIIPDFSIKIEQLPINIIKELSLTFDKLHKTIGDSGLSDENLQLFNKDNELQSSEDFSIFLQQFCSDDMSNQNLNNCIKVDVNDGTLSNQESGNLESIEILDSDEENLHSVETEKRGSSPSHQISNSIAEVIVPLETTVIEYFSSQNLSPSSNWNCKENDFPTTVPCKERKEIEISSNQPNRIETIQSLYNPLNDINKITASEDLFTGTSQKTNPLQTDENEMADLTHSQPLDPVKVEIDILDNEIPPISPELKDFNPQPKVGSVWVSKNIFETFTAWSGLEQGENGTQNEIHVSDSLNRANSIGALNNVASASELICESPLVYTEQNSNVAMNIDLVPENSEINISNVTSGSNQKAEPESVSSEINPNGAVQEPNNEICMLDLPNLQLSGSVVSTSIKDPSSLIEINNENMVKDIKTKTRGTKKIQAPSRVVAETSSNSTIENDLNTPQSSDVTSNCIISTPETLPATLNSTPDSNFVCLTIKPFDKPKNLEDAISLMTVIDKHIGVLTKLRQDIFIGLSKSVAESNVVTPRNIKMELQESCETMRKSAGKSTVNEVQYEIIPTQESIPEPFVTRIVQENNCEPLQKSALQEINPKTMENTLMQERNLNPKPLEKSLVHEINSKTSEKTLEQTSIQKPLEKTSVQESYPKQLQVSSVQEINSKISGETSVNDNNPKPLKNTQESNLKQFEKRIVQESNSKSFEKSLVQEKNSKTSEKPSAKKPEPYQKTSTQESNPKPVAKRVQESVPEPFDSLKSVNAVVLFCKVIYDEEECIIGTNNGKIEYHSIYENTPPMVVQIYGYSPISFLEFVRVNEKGYIFTGNDTDRDMKMMKYKKKYIQRIHLEDTVQVLRNDWGFFFIGGKRGYLTRYDWRKDRIQYEDRISQSGIKQLKTTKEGPRKILIILFEDADGVAHVHVRDALTALHIRTIIDMKNVRSMFLRYSSVFLVTDEQISVYNCCDGNYIRKIPTQRPFPLLCSKGNLLILGASDGIYGYNLKTNKYLGCLKEGVSVSSLLIHEQQILYGTWSKGVEVFDLPDHCKDILEYN